MFFQDLYIALVENGLFEAFALLYEYMPIWLPLILGALFIQAWVEYVRTDYISKQAFTLLEVRLPREILKSPLAMEIVMGIFHQASKGNYIGAYWEGKVRPWFSLELVSLEGQVKFFIWTPANHKNLIEAQIYSQYPEVEVYEVEDYTKPVVYNPEVNAIFASQFKLTKPDPYPIKTYVDYGMDKDPDAEVKIDPMTALIEYLGSLKKDEQVWLQILIQGHREEGLKDARLRKKPDWKKGAEEEVQKIRDKLKTDDGYERRATKGEEQTITALERSISKLPFDTMIRVLYIAKKEIFNKANIGGVLGCLKQYSSSDLNGFAPNKSTTFDYPWQDFRGMRVNTMKRKYLDAYKRRSFFNTPYKYLYQRPFILNAEELATIFHFPGSVAATPTLQKSGSKKAEAPANLPI